ncbi:hypothetical protein JTE90_007198 [Oedothorax gibbosus]|uniref:Lymphoid-restricted membrane protein n=1 Tax=Oedothorax gibbosus TaxID=931172 RepID=A0AAV6UDQ2_9ARAC|nr:hypothetical protein JTE90_007198 [Oedothorax gibbosus]
MSRYSDLHPTSSNDRMGSSVQDLRNQKSRLPRKTPLKAKSLKPPKQIRQQTVDNQMHSTKLITSETAPNEHSEVKLVPETSNILFFGCQDTGPKVAGHDQKCTNGNTKDSETDETSNIPLLDCQSTGPRPNGKEKKCTGPNKYTKCSEIEETSNIPLFVTGLLSQASLFVTSQDRKNTVPNQDNKESKIKETSNNIFFDYQDTGSRSNGQDQKFTYLNRDTKESKFVETSNFPFIDFESTDSRSTSQHQKNTGSNRDNKESKIEETSSSPLFDSHDTDSRPIGQDQKSIFPNRETKVTEIEETSNRPLFDNQVSGPIPTGQDRKNTGPNRNNKESKTEETSNSPFFDCQDNKGPRPNGQDRKSIGLNFDTKDFEIEETSNRPLFDCQDTGPIPTGQNKKSNALNRDTKGYEIEETSNCPIYHSRVCPTPTGQEMKYTSEVTNRDTEGTDMEDLDLQEIVKHASMFDTHVDVVNASPETNIKLGEPFIIHLLDVLRKELSQKGDDGSGVNLVEARNILRHALAISNDNFRAASLQLSLATKHELANLKQEMELLAQEMIEAIQKAAGVVKKCRELLPERLSADHQVEKILEEGKNEAGRRKHKEELGANRYSCLTFLVIFLLIVANIQIFVLHAIAFRNHEHLNKECQLMKTGFLHDLTAWLNSTHIYSIVSKLL